MPNSHRVLKLSGNELKSHSPFDEDFINFHFERSLVHPCKFLLKFK